MSTSAESSRLGIDDPDLIRARATVLRCLRDWLHEHGYLEVHTPIIVPSGAMEEHLEPVRLGTAHLHTSPEFALKRVLARGLCRVYQVVPCFREEEVGRHHSREFTMLEWYRVGAGTPELMDEVEEVINRCAESLGGTPLNWQRVAVSDLLDDTGEPDEWFRRWVDDVEPRLDSPTIVHSYPAWQAALAQVRGDVADRFEVYLGGIELANAFAELTCGDELETRWQASNMQREASGRPAHPVDPRIVEATRRLPRCAGIAVGVDRLVMALTGASHICQVQVR
ncbi:MAG: amino acid--tRNA ligase-related protein [Myxococcota bacterium]|nr:amino acid--tRNA ligase-related protein [Myxococcota bacterium]